MFKKILVPTDGSALAHKAIGPAVSFAKEINATIVAIAVAEPPALSLWDGAAVPLDMNEFENKAHALAEQHVQALMNLANAANVPCETVVAVGAHPHQEIINTAIQHQCDIIFMASHGRKGLNSLLLGSETQKVLAHSTIPVLVYR